MNVSSLTPWLLDFHTVQFSGSSGCFLFLNWLLSFFWLCEEAKYIYLCLYLGQKSSETFPSKEIDSEGDGELSLAKLVCFGEPGVGPFLEAL